MARNRTISNRIQIKSNKPNLGQKSVVFKNFSRKIIMLMLMLTIITHVAFSPADCASVFIYKTCIHI